MSALALPINALMPVVDNAKEQTKCVVVCSKAERADKVTVFHIAWKTLRLRGQFAKLVNQQEQLLGKLVERDFCSIPTGEIKELAGLIDNLVRDERELLEHAHQLGSEIRIWWDSSLVKLSSQVEHLDSIAESLHVASDDKASTLLGFAVEQFAM